MNARYLPPTLMYPLRVCCGACRRWLLAGEGALCADCQARLNARRLADARRSLGQLVARWPEWLRAPLLADPPLTGALAAFPYVEEARVLSLRLKFNRAFRAALPLAEGMARAWAAAPDGDECLVAVPLHPRRRARRGYDQAALLAGLLAFHTGLSLLTGALVRTLHTPPQTEQPYEDRLLNVRGAFAVPEPGLIAGRRVLLADDVLTTGATAVACASALRAAGAASVRLITACRT